MGVSWPRSSAPDEPAARAWVVRGGRQGEMVAHDLRENVVTLGWGDWINEADGVEQADGETLDRIFAERYAKKYPESVRRRCRQEILRFRDRVCVGDLVVLPLKNHGPEDALAAVGEVDGPIAFDPDQSRGARLGREVTWLAREVAKSAVRPDLRSSIQRPQLTVFQPRAANSAWRIYRIATHGVDPLAASAGEP